MNLSKVTPDLSTLEVVLSVIALIVTSFVGPYGMKDNILSGDSHDFLYSDPQRRFFRLNLIACFEKKASE